MAEEARELDTRREVQPLKVTQRKGSTNQQVGSRTLLRKGSAPPTAPRGKSTPAPAPPTPITPTAGTEKRGPPVTALHLDQLRARLQQAEKERKLQLAMRQLSEKRIVQLEESLRSQTQSARRPSGPGRTACPTCSRIIRPSGGLATGSVSSPSVRSVNDVSGWGEGRDHSTDMDIETEVQKRIALEVKQRMKEEIRAMNQQQAAKFKRLTDSYTEHHKKILQWFCDKQKGRIEALYKTYNDELKEYKGVCQQLQTHNQQLCHQLETHGIPPILPPLPPMLPNPLLTTPAGQNGHQGAWPPPFEASRRSESPLVALASFAPTATGSTPIAAMGARRGSGGSPMMRVAESLSLTDRSLDQIPLRWMQTQKAPPKRNGSTPTGA